MDAGEARYDRKIALKEHKLYARRVGGSPGERAWAQDWIDGLKEK